MQEGKEREKREKACSNLNNSFDARCCKSLLSLPYLLSALYNFSNELASTAVICY